MRSSIEGLNQEIEGLVLKNTANNSDTDHPVEDKVVYINFAIVGFITFNIFLLIRWKKRHVWIVWKKKTVLRKEYFKLNDSVLLFFYAIYILNLGG